MKWNLDQSRSSPIALKKLLLLVLASLICLSTSSYAQNIQFTQGSVGSGLDNTVNVTIWTYPGRGATSLPVTLTYSSRVWRIGHLKSVHNLGYDQSIAEAIYSEYSTAGWKSSLDLPIIEWPKANDTYYHYGAPFCECESNANQYRVARVFVHMPDGSTHELRQSDQPYSGAMIQTGTFYAVDGSRMRYDSASATTGTLYLADGTRYELNGATAKYIDRNGNALRYDAATREWTDTLERHISNPLPAVPQAGSPVYYTPPGFSTPYTFVWKELKDALTPDANNQSPQRLAVGSDYLPNPNGPVTPIGYGNFPLDNTSGGTVSSLFTRDVPEDADDGAQYTLVVGRGQSQDQLFNPIVLAEIDLPNGLSYKFSYNIYGEIDKITYPTGAFEQSTYNKLPPLGELKSPYNESNRGVISRKLSANGAGNDFAEWSYSSTGAVVTSTAPDETGAAAGTRTETIRQSVATPEHISSRGVISHFWPFGFEDAQQGTVVDERVYAPAAQGGAMMRRTLSEFDETRNAVQPLLSGDATKTAYRNARPIKTVSLIIDTGGEALAKTITEEYTSNGNELTTGLNRTASEETYFRSVDQITAQTGAIAAMPLGLPASRAETTYLNDPAYDVTRNILGLPTLVVLKDANLQTVSKSESFYDEAAYPLLPYGDLSGTDYNDPGTNARGNVTTGRRYIDVNAGTYLETHAQFDQCGNLRVVTNERGIQSSVDYSSDYKHAFATQTTSAVPDPSGNHGLNEALTSSSTFDSTTGLVLTTTDANGQVTSYSYRDDSNVIDPLNRLRKVTRPDGGWSKYSFGETVGDLFMKTETVQDTNQGTARAVRSYQYADPLGRASRGFVSEGGDSYIASDTIYDKLGRAWKVSNPYRTTTHNGIAGLSHTSDWTVSHYDALSRVDYVTLPDSSMVDTDPRGIYTTVTDQAGRQRRQKVDALGRIVRVDEPDSSGNLGTEDAPVQPSFYQYNTQGNLIAISQGLSQQNLNPEDPANYIQHRYFKYDSLGRLTYEKQAEQVGYFSAPDSLTGNGAWSRKLVYDETVNNVSYAGLLTTAYDARNISTQFKYDNLNRIRQVDYSDGTPEVNNYYDQPVTNYFNKGHLTLASTAAVVAGPAHDIPAIPATSQSYNYDLMGRVANNQQTVGDQSYIMSYGYNLGGAMTSEQYPSGRVVSYAFDDGARLSQVSSGNTVYANQFDYSTTQGLLKSVTLGNGAVETYGYNSRLQLSSLDLTKSGTQLQHYDYKYGVYDPNANTLDESKNTGQIARIEGLIGATKQWQQNFEYDSLGRLKSGREFRGDNGAQTWLVNYDYDVFGNRYQRQANNANNPFSQVWVEDGAFNSSTNRFAANGSYDDAGNILTDQKFRQLTFQYDANNRQKQSSNLDDSGVVVSVYDAGGQRVATEVGGSLTNVLVYDAGGKLLAEYGSTAPTGGTQYVFSDHQGSPRAITNSSGAVMSRHDYAPFGEELGALGMRSSGQGYGNGDAARQKYAGMESDDATGMDHTLWRQYDNLTGRWTAPDPYGGSMTPESPQSFNRYGYVNNDPLNKIDPTGLMLSDIGVYQTANPEAARLTERAEDQGVKNWVTQHQEQPHTRDHSSHFGGPGGNGGENNHAYAAGPSEHSDSGSGSPGDHSEPQNATKNPYEICREQTFGTGDTFMGKHIPDYTMSYYLLAAGATINDSAFAASIVAKESDFNWHAKEDHGPAQLTSWWKNNHRELIVEGAYDPFPRPDNGPLAKNRDREFTGSVLNNILTLGNIVGFQRRHHGGNEYMMAKTYYSGRGDQDAYAKEVLWRYEAYKPFFKCLGAK